MSGVTIFRKRRDLAVMVWYPGFKAKEVVAEVLSGPLKPEDPGQVISPFLGFISKVGVMTQGKFRWYLILSQGARDAQQRAFSHCSCCQHRFPGPLRSHKPAPCTVSEYAFSKSVGNMSLQKKVALTLQVLKITLRSS